MPCRPFSSRDFIILTALTYLFLRRVVSPQIRYISLASDYLALLLILGVVISGILMRSVFKVDVDAVKRAGYIHDHIQAGGPCGHRAAFLYTSPAGLHSNSLFPLQQDDARAGILLSPTRNLKNDSRWVRHVNPWNRPVRVHTYEEYEDEFRKPMIEAGIPVEKKNHAENDGR